MNTPKGELARFIYSECYNELFRFVSKWVAEHPNSLEILYSTFDPDTATVQGIMIEFTTNVTVVGDVIRCDVVVSCDPILLEQDNYGRTREKVAKKWFRVSCVITIEDTVKSFTCHNISPYNKTQKKQLNGRADNNLVPIIGKKHLDDEATNFLTEYWPDALNSAMPVPIEKIIKDKMGLSIIKGAKLTDNLGVFGQINFSAGKVKIYDGITDIEKEVEVERGTIIIDAKTYWERNLGCVNNTMAHEAFHWHKHRVYAAVRSLLNKEKYIAQRCPSVSLYRYSDDEKIEWTDEERMEWQANHVAPRILMPVQTTKPKIKELLTKYNYDGNPSERNFILEAVIDELSRFYKVSKQSAKIRMIDLGYLEANGVYNFCNNTNYFNSINRRDAFYEYCDNIDFREIIDSGLFRYVEDYYIIDDERYVLESNSRLSPALCAGERSSRSDRHDKKALI